jgi:hypothetical protein
MKTLSKNQMENTEAGFPWGSFLSGAFCAIGVLTAETGVGLVIAGASCGAAFVTD